jgi:predicted CopG family antitoxin
MELPVVPVKRKKPSPSRRKTPWVSVAVKTEVYVKLQQISSDAEDSSVAETVRKLIENAYEARKEKEDVPTATTEERNVPNRTQYRARY